MKKRIRKVRVSKDFMSVPSGSAIYEAVMCSSAKYYIVRTDYGWKLGHDRSEARDVPEWVGKKVYNIRERYLEFVDEVSMQDIYEL